MNDVEMTEDQQRMYDLLVQGDDMRRFVMDALIASLSKQVHRATKGGHMPQSVRAEAIRSILAGERTKAQVAMDLGVQYHTVRKWMLRHHGEKK